ncbi:MAG: D-alanyl-D-alanine carboxypeptidase/D-alanyl-D-alanine-endopeptidase [Bacteroidota bacterium]
MPAINKPEPGGGAVRTPSPHRSRRESARSPLFLFLIAAMAAGSCRHPGVRDPLREGLMRLPSTAASPLLQQAVDALLADSLFPPSNAGIDIVSLETDEVLYALNPEMLFTPGSNAKLLTAAGALTLLPADAAMVTEIAPAARDSSVLVITGSGDPFLSGAEMDSIASRLASLLPAGRSWTLVGDCTRFDGAAWGKGWMHDDEPDPSAPFQSPLSFNGNTVTVVVAPGGEGGDPARVHLEPPTGFVRVSGAVLTREGGVQTPLGAGRLWTEGANVVRLEGEIARGDSARRFSFSLRNPPLFFLQALRERMEQRGLCVAAAETASGMAQGEPLLVFSRSIDSVVAGMNKKSDNLAAENLLKYLDWALSGAPGSTEGGVGHLRRMLGVMGADTSRLVLADGSGVSRYNLVSARTLTRVLRRVRENPKTRDRFLASLPLAGVDGTLRNRMKGTAAAGRVRAKTGTMAGVSALTGFVETADGEPLAFSILMQHYAAPAEVYRAVQDSIAVLLARLKGRIPPGGNAPR